MSHVQNGVDVEQLVGTINVVKAEPSLAQFKFRANMESFGGGPLQDEDSELLRSGPGGLIA